MNNSHPSTFFLLVAVLFAATLSQLSAADPQPVVSNPGFEQPTAKTAEEVIHRPIGWMIFSKGPRASGISSRVPHRGKQCAWICVPKKVKSDAYQGLAQSIPVESGKAYRLAAYVRADPSLPLTETARGQLSIEWQDDGQKEIDRSWGPDWGSALPVEWTSYEITATAPVHATRANLVITLHIGANDASSGKFYVDDVTFKPAP